MKCETKFCRNRAAKNRRHCHKCRSRKFREADPIRALFYNLKHHAKQRGHEFHLTRDEFAAFCESTGYHLTVGRTAQSSSIDRIDGSKPYQAGNIQISTVSNNAIKSWFDGSRFQQAAPVCAGSIVPDDGPDPW